MLHLKSERLTGLIMFAAVLAVGSTIVNHPLLLGLEANAFTSSDAAPSNRYTPANQAEPANVSRLIEQR